MRGRGRRCLICGAPHATCGGPSASIPIDAHVKQEVTVAGGKLVRVEVIPGVVLKLTAEDAKKYPATAQRPRQAGPDDPASAYTYLDDASAAEKAAELAAKGTPGFLNSAALKGEPAPAEKAVPAPPEDKAVPAPPEDKAVRRALNKAPKPAKKGAAAPDIWE